MIVSHSRRFIFLRTEKTGGTSLTAALRAIAAPGDTYPGEVRPSWSKHLPFSYGGLQRNLPDVFGLHPHATAAQARRVLGRRVFDSYFKFAIERNPWDRQVSLYTHREWKKGRNNDGFDRHMRSPLYRNTEYCRLNNWSIYTIDGTVVADKILRYETLAEEIETLQSLVGAKLLEAMPRMRAYDSDRPHYSTFYTDASRDRVAGWYRREIEAFGYTFEDHSHG
ncbi:MAG: sulfotransferase family 2 domain-containing protein [Devosia sp.]